MVFQSLADKILSQSPFLSYGKLGYVGRKGFWDESLTLENKTIVITGATSGIGKAAAIQMSKLGANIILIGRNQKKLESTVEIIQELSPNNKSGVEFFVADLSEPSACIAVADKVSKAHPKIDGLINNAGAMFKLRKVNSKGQEITFSTNVLSGFILTNKLLPNLEKSESGRIVHVSSGGMYLHRLEPDDLNFERRPYKDLASYAQSKRCQVILNELWAQKLNSNNSRVRTDCMHPGWVETPGLEDSMPKFSLYLNPILRNPDEGADTIVWLCATKNNQSPNGSFWLDRKPRETHISKKTHNTAPEREALWHYCVDQTGIDFPVLKNI